MDILKSLLFYPMLWLRVLLLGIGTILSGFLLFATLLMVIAKLIFDINNMSWLRALMPAIMGFSIFMLMEFYDQILLKLTPNNYNLTLYK